MSKDENKILSQGKIDQLLIEACCKANLKAVKYLLTSPVLEKHASIKGWDEEAFICACRTKNIELVDYMLRSPELKEHSNIHTWGDMIFNEACNRKDVNLLNYLIFDYKINETDEISKCLKNKNLIKIAKVFELREESERITEAYFPKDEVLAKSKKKLN
jgi:hypothetical protein